MHKIFILFRSLAFRAVEPLPTLLPTPLFELLFVAHPTSLLSKKKIALRSSARRRQYVVPCAALHIEPMLFALSCVLPRNCLFCILLCSSSSSSSLFTFTKEL